MPSKGGKKASAGIGRPVMPKRKSKSKSKKVRQGGYQTSRRASRNSDNSLRQSFASLNDQSISDLSAVLDVKKQLSSRGVKWAEDVDTKQISMLRRSAIDDMFYTSTDIAEFRHAAFMEECGLDPADFD